MLLLIATALTLLGFLAWGLGLLFEFTGLAVIGGVVFVGVGAAVTTGGLQYQSGEELRHTYNNSTGEQLRNTTVVEPVYSEYQPDNTFPLGVLGMLLGSLMVFRGFDNTT